MHQIAIEISFSSFFSASRAFPFQAISRCVCLLDLRDLLYSWLELCKTISINLDANFGSMVREDHNIIFYAWMQQTCLLCQGKSCLLII